ncbi:unnamed protein product [Candidula unifasciata]|uniref:Heparanase n=1 Tax=Candidula unifasciata TaxID=100452 RepID=A0A8S3YK82_9EUPU|nr:unnamed protein product [Candidula unifasciata]
MRWKQYDFQSLKFQNLAAALAPIDVRLGGTYSDFMIFDPNGTDSFKDKQAPELYGNGYKFDSGFFDSPFQLENFTLSGKHWDILNTFIEKVGWNLMFDFNLFKWKGDLWDPSNAELLLNYSSERGIKIPYFQLGNEPNSYRHNFNLTVSPQILAEDYRILKSLISKYPLYNTSRLYGPDVTNLNVPHGSIQYLTDFLLSGAYNVISGISLHHYYLNARTATQDQFVNLTVLNSLKSQLQLALDIVTSSPVPLPVLLTETSSCFGGGATNLSDAYLAGFLWLDKLGLSAQYGISRVFRQTFLGGSYGLLDQNMNPYPDYYLSVLFKRLIEGPVFSVITEPADQQLRVYAHCARKNIYQAGDLVIYYLNIKDIEINLDLPQFQNADLDLYLLTPGDEAGLKSRYVRLNGDLLLLSNSTLPPLNPRPHRGPVTVSPMSFGFIVVPNFSVSLCLKYFARSANRG